jgi:hypothetical protein
LQAHFAIDTAEELVADKTIYEELRDVLKDFNEFLQAKIGVIKPPIQALAQVVPQVNDLIDKPIGLLAKLKTEIQSIDIGPLGNIDEALGFAAKIKGFLESAKALLPDEAAEIDRVINAADVVAGLPTFGDIKNEIIQLIDGIAALLGQLKA